MAAMTFAHAAPARSSSAAMGRRPKRRIELLHRGSLDNCHLCSRFNFLTIRHPGQAHRASLALAEWLCQRLIGSIRRECVDHFIVFGEAHLRRILRTHARYYNDIRTHRSLDKDAPVSRSVQRTGIISSRPILGGLHHHYVRV
jgi:hypothetical protein